MAEGADALFLVSEGPECQTLVARLTAQRFIPAMLDGRNLFDPEEARPAGRTNIGVGR